MVTDRSRVLNFREMQATVSAEATEKKEELVQLSKKKTAGVISATEENKLQELRKTFSTDDKIEL